MLWKQIGIQPPRPMPNKHTPFTIVSSITSLHENFQNLLASRASGLSKLTGPL